jgi:murein DD-endopeptidase MepM/ murein hydrolase activator NlpD
LSRHRGALGDVARAADAEPGATLLAERPAQPATGVLPLTGVQAAVLDLDVTLPPPSAHPSLPVPPLPPRRPAAVAVPPVVGRTDTAPDVAETRPSRLRRLVAGMGGRLPSCPPRRRAPLLLAALVAGGVVAALPGSPTDAPAAGDGMYGLDVAADLSASGGLDDVEVRQGITAAEARRRLDDLAASRAARTPQTVLPTQGYMSTCFCMRWGQMHWGIDLAAPLGTPIVSATDGVVLRAGPSQGFGNAVYIQDTDGNVEVYGHMRYMFVDAGQVVHAGDLIAKVGTEGQSTGPHLHFEIRQGSATGKRLDPQAWLQQRSVSVTG